MLIEPGDGPHGPALPPQADPAALDRVPFGPAVARVPYAELDTTAGMDTWLTTLMAEGAVVVTGAPGTEGEVVRMAERIGFARPTNFGLLFDVVSIPDPTSNGRRHLQGCYLDGTMVRSRLRTLRRQVDYRTL